MSKVKTAKKKSDDSTGLPSPVNTSLSATLGILRGFKGGALDHIVPVTSATMNSTWPHVPIGNVKLEYLIGGPFNERGTNCCPGFPRGAITNIYGKEHCGKTSMALMACAAVTAQGGSVLYIDYEHILDRRYAKKLGVPVEDEDRFALLQPQTLEQGIASLLVAANSGVDLVVFDSVGAAVPKKLHAMSLEEVEKDDTGAMGLMARQWSKYLPMISGSLGKHKTALLAISQTRAAIGQSKSDTVQGGNGWKFWSALRLELTPLGGIKGKEYDPITHTYKENVLGRIVRVRVKKNKVAGTSNWETTVDVLPNRGFDPLRSAVQVCEAHKRVQKKSSWISYIRPNGDEVKGNGEVAFYNELTKIPGIIREMSDMAKPYLTSQDVAPDAPDESDVPPEGIDDASFDIESLVEED